MTKRTWVLLMAFLVLRFLIFPSLAVAGEKRHRQHPAVEEMQPPADYAIDLQLAINNRPAMMHGAGEMTGAPDNELGDRVFDNLVRSGFSQPYRWKLTLVNDGVVNARSTAGGQVYVYGGMLKILSGSPGLWAAVLSHEVAHTGLRHQVRVVLQQLYIRQMIAYYRARAIAGDNSANWALLGFEIAAPLALKKMERDQEHQADQTGMLLMARAGYHPDFVYALHHLLRLNTGERSKFAGFFSDHPRWETRDQRSERVYADALAEYNRLWPNPELSPGGTPPPVAFVGPVKTAENKAAHAADLVVPLFCRNEPKPVNVIVVFLKNNQPMKAGTENGDVLRYWEAVQCPDEDSAAPVVLHVPASTVTGKDRKT